MNGGDMIGSSTGGGGGTVSKMLSPGKAESQYVGAKTSVWWDIENCQVPKGLDSNGIAQSISSALVKMNYCGPVSISAYGDTNRIPASVQNALSSTGIALNHVPAGVKDASDKKILVDMLFWAVDNPAPANYLLISGDRDFSNALHQLRMRRYNILLAQPQQASAPLVAAAKSVWLWTTIAAGGPPLTNGESKQLCNSRPNSEIFHHPVSEPMQFSQPMDSCTATGRVSDYQYNRNFTQPNPNHPIIPRAQSMPVFSQDNKNSDSANQQKNTLVKPFKKAPHEFFRGKEAAVSSSMSIPEFVTNNNPSGNNGHFFTSRPQNPFALPSRPNTFPTQPPCAPDKLLHSNSYTQGFCPMPLPPRSNTPRFSSVPLINIPNSGNQCMSQYPNYAQNHPRFSNPLAEEFKTSSVNLNFSPSGFIPQNGQATFHNPPSNVYTCRPELPPSSHTIPRSGGKINNVRGTQPSDYVQGLIGFVLSALNSLRSEKVMPTEANIIDCIRFGDPKLQKTEVRRALDSAIERHMIVKQNLGALLLYVGKNEKLWKCVNIQAGNPNDFPKDTWIEIEKFLNSSSGRAAILASQCRYEAALILRKACLEKHSLGNALQVLNMVIINKKWIIHHPSGWQPIRITLAETTGKTGTKTGA